MSMIYFATFCHYKKTVRGFLSVTLPAFCAFRGLKQLCTVSVNISPQTAKNKVREGSILSFIFDEIKRYLFTLLLGLPSRYILLGSVNEVNFTLKSGLSACMPKDRSYRGFFFLSNVFCWYFNTITSR